MRARSSILVAGCSALSLATVGLGATTTAASAGRGPIGGRVAGLLTKSKPPTSAQCLKLYSRDCYSPAQVQRAYNLRALYRKGLTGRGRTIVIVDPFGSPTIRHDLDVFDHGFRLPAPSSFHVLQPVGKVPPYNPDDPEMVEKAGETTLDVEWSHAIAPGADILLVETPVAQSSAGGGFPQYMAAENYVVRHKLGDVISQSFGLPEENFPSRSFVLGLRYAYVNAFRHRVSVLAASNDFGVSGPEPSGLFYTQRVVYWPASDPLVTAVGGTRLHLDAAGRRTSPDTAWNDVHSTAVAKAFHTTPPIPFASNGGISTIFRRPIYQNQPGRTLGARRSVPDVSMSAALSGGVAVFTSFAGASPPGWTPAGGTSEATPEFAGIAAIADQYAGRRLGLINPALYLLQRTRGRGIVDITRGDNTVSFVENGRIFTVTGYRANPGYDRVTGIGTIDAARLVPELARRR